MILDYLANAILLREEREYGKIERSISPGKYSFDDEEV